MATNIYRVHGAPDSTTFGNVGDMYIDLDTNSLYQCVGVNVRGRDCGYITIYLGEGENTEYAWVKTGGGGSKMLDDFIKGVPTDISSNAVTIREALFDSNESLTSVDFPACKIVGDWTFSFCFGLTSVNFPACTSIGESAFINCSSLTAVDFPVCTSIGTCAFGECTSLTSANFPACTSIGESAFVNIGGSLTFVNFPVCTSIGNAAFGTCAGITSVNFPVCTSIGDMAFGDCAGLTSIDFPACKSVGNWAFGSCTNLHTVDFSETVRIGSYAFEGCANLKSVILRSSSVCTMDADAFSGIGTESYVIYVPSSMLSAYSKADGWSALYNLGRIKAIESMT